MIKKIFFIVLVSLFLLSCEKENIIVTGKLVLEFENSSNVVYLYPLENQTKPLFKIYMNGENSKSQKMNMGNYYCVVGDIDTNYAGVVFQIQPDKVTRINYKDNTPIVTYE